MSNLTAGLLGGIIGTSHAVDELSAERRHEMALNLRREALAEIDRKHQARGFTHAESLQEADIASREKQSAEDIKSREKIASGRNTVLEKIAGMENSMKKRLLAADKKSTEAKNLRARIAALTEARKVIEGGGSTDEANAVLEVAGLPLMEEYIVEEGRTGILGFGKKEPVTGRRVAGSAGTTLTAQKPTVVKSELDALLTEGRKSIKPSESEKTESDLTVVKESKLKPRGILSRAHATKIPTRKQDFGDPLTWDVIEQSGQYFVKTVEGIIQLTPEQVKQWKAATGK
jgi:hypothetical protein